MECPLCRQIGAIPFWQDNRRTYHRCPACLLVFVPTDQILTREEEKAQYDLHQNSPDDPGYRRFLSRLSMPLLERLAPVGRGLDFGSGPGPTLSRMLAEAGHEVLLYDPFYAPDTGVFHRRYDFITATEVVEHLRDPDRELKRLWQCLRPDGILAIMTKLVLSRDAFSRWHYKNDLTHIRFFSRSTFQWLASRLNAELTFADKDVILLRQGRASAPLPPREPENPFHKRAL